MTALLFHSCHDESHTLIEDEVAISMTASSADMSTSRALVTDNTTLQKTALGVYGYKEVNSNKTMVFNNTELTYTANKGWDYSPTKYWDKAATEYRFVAYSPHFTSNISYNTNNHTLTISNIPYWQVIGNDVVDYLVATSSGSADHYLTEQQASTAVNFTFSHILSQLVIKVVKDDNLTNIEYKVKRIEYINVPEGGEKATYTYSSSTSGFSEISIISSPSSVSMLEQEKDVTLDKVDNIISLPHLVVPFTLSDGKNVKVKVTYTVAGTERNKTVDTGITQLVAGKRYELTLTFKGAEIVPSLEIKNWDDVSVDEDPKYNW